MKKLITVAFVLAFVGTCLALYSEGEAQDKPVVITKKVVYHDPILDEDFSAKEFPIPPRVS